MRKYIITLVVLVLVWHIFLTLPSPQALPAQQEVNWLVNGGFEDGFTKRKPLLAEITVAEGWHPWWRGHDWWMQDWEYRIPTFREYNKDWYAEIFPTRAHEGHKAQQLYSSYATHEAGILQTIFNVTPGSKVVFSIWVMGWSSRDNRQDRSTNEYWAKIGISPTGDTNPYGQIQWSQKEEITDRWVRLEISTIAQAEQVTVFTWGKPDYSVKHNNSYWDEAVLVVTEPTPTPIPPTVTPFPTATPTSLPTTTPLFTPVVSPTETLTPQPTATATIPLIPSPTVTMPPTATETPSPTPTISLGSICVIIFADANGNGERDNGETILGHWIKLLDETGGLIAEYRPADQIEPSTFLPICFNNLDPGIYRLVDSEAGKSVQLEIPGGLHPLIEFAVCPTSTPIPTSTLEPAPTQKPTPTPTPQSQPPDERQINRIRTQFIVLMVFLTGVMLFGVASFLRKPKKRRRR